MGYYTEYTLHVVNVDGKNDFVALRQELKDRELIGYAFDDGAYPATVTNNKNLKHNDAIFYPYDEVKWYDCTDDMREISEKFPKMYFELSGEGEEYGDYWKEYFHDGTVEHCNGEIVYEEPKKIIWKELERF